VQNYKEFVPVWRTKATNHSHWWHENKAVPELVS